MTDDLERLPTPTEHAAAMQQWLRDGTVPAEYVRRVLGDPSVTVSSTGEVTRLSSESDLLASHAAQEAEWEEKRTRDFLNLPDY